MSCVLVTVVQSCALPNSFLERADAQFRPLKIDEDRHRPPDFLFKRADGGAHLGPVLLRPVAHVHAKGVGPRQMQRAAHFGGTRRRPERRQNADSAWRSAEHTSELQSLMRNSYAAFRLHINTHHYIEHLAFT